MDFQVTKHFKLGLTGGIGCGKSTVEQLFAAAGWRTIQTDAVARDFLEHDSVIQAALRKRWGSVVINAEGQVDRAAIADRVFSDSVALKWLEQLLHPRVHSFWQQSINEDADADWLVEIPLLFEKRLENAFDLIVCVDCPSDIADARMQGRGYSKAQVQQRRLRQMPLEHKAERADLVISNAGSIEFLTRQTNQLIKNLVN
jgi:dephospho-CoA kinase